MTVQLQTCQTSLWAERNTVLPIAAEPAARDRPSSPGLPFWGQVLATVSSEKGQNGVNRIARYCTARVLAVGFDLLSSTGHAALGGTITRPPHPAARQAHDYSGGG